MSQVYKGLKFLEDNYRETNTKLVNHGDGDWGIDALLPMTHATTVLKGLKTACTVSLFQNFINNKYAKHGLSVSS